ncbi:SusC/RagA family TonB-linked outer membrane protein [Porphyromonas cangingivalis]|uniref:SusC/RagA family TonB-linked outer membrane protein n=1 Tax=Porphyromonas cangingivalis TaxID=36874 RepID=UPI00051DC52E|nr:SusC/RagA family TonB-linked outer membrane protein [Porphyromonas cangingivalis]KGL50223.1 membrane receptor RagA [Porphyromonas cangingivalis]
MKKRLGMLLVLLLVSVVSASAQTLTVKGIVLDEKSDPVPFCPVRLKSDPSKGAHTDADGKFTLQATKGAILVVSYVGYVTQEVAAMPQLTIKLQPNSEVLDDVVVIGYMTRKVANTSASVVKIDGGQLANKPTANPLDAVQGKVTGLQVYSSSGEPSAGLSIELHGHGSLGAGTSPLIIMDGIPVSTNTIRAMNPNDIESVQFLKDAAATSIYGARAANGVIYITTKRGVAEDRARVSVRAQYGVSSLANSDYFDQLMTADELLRYYEETKIYTPEQISNFRDKLFKGNDFRWYKYIYQPAPLYTADASVSGGTGRTNYYISGGLLDQKGLRMGSSYQKAYARLNLNTSFSDYVRAGVNTSVSYDETMVSPFGANDRTGGGLAAMNPPFISPYDNETGKVLDYIELLDITSPNHVIGTHPSKSNAFIFSANANVTITPMNGLNIRSLAGIESSFGTSASRLLPSFRRAYGVGSSSRAYQGSVNFSTTNTISYDFSVADDHHFTTLLGHEYVNYADEGFSASGSGILDDRLFMLNNVTKDQVVSESGLGYAFLSFFSQVSYDYAEKYFVDLVLRNDASSRFGRNRRNGLFWSAGLLWKAKREDFLKDISWLNELDVKASYGTQGNSSIPPYVIESYSGKVGQKKGEMSLGFISLGNPDLGWERQSKLTVGFKTRVWDRFTLNLEYYNRITSDMLFEVPLSLSTGLPMGRLDFVTRYQNVGSYLNHGIDLRLDVDMLRGKGYGLSGYFNFSYNQDRVLKLFDGRQRWYEPNSQLVYIVGKPVTYVAALYKGVNTQTGVPEWYRPGEDKDVTTRDDNNIANMWSSSLEQNTGIPAYTPMTGGWGLVGSWKNFYLNADFSFAIGKYMFSMDKQRFENDYYVRDKETELNGSRRLFDYWKQPGDVAEFPSLEWVRSKNEVRQSTYFDSKMLENASFMRLKNLTIGYQVPSAWLKGQRILTNAKVYFAGRNLLTFTKFRGIDPEVNHNVSMGANPNTKQLSVGVELGF